MPTGIAGVSGVIEWTVVGDNSIPPLTPANLLHTLGTVVGRPELKMVFTKMVRGTKPTRLPTGHAVCCVFEFPSGGWRCPAHLRGSDYRVGPRSELCPVSLSGYKRAATRRPVSETSGPGN
eukprot:15450014-Alexandrium_andersonii.AAC.1